MSGREEGEGWSGSTQTTYGRTVPYGLVLAPISDTRMVFVKPDLPGVLHG